VHAPVCLTPCQSRKPWLANPCQETVYCCPICHMRLSVIERTILQTMETTGHTALVRYATPLMSLTFLGKLSLPFFGNQESRRCVQVEYRSVLQAKHAYCQEQGMTQCMETAPNNMASSYGKLHLQVGEPLSTEGITRTLDSLSTHIREYSCPVQL
jgi:hypothetical protein